jgi:hypothetical protein
MFVIMRGIQPKLHQRRRRRLLHRVSGNIRPYDSMLDFNLGRSRAQAGRRHEHERCRKRGCTNKVKHFR